MNRRTFLHRLGLIAGASVLAGAAGVSYAFEMEPNQLVLERVTVPLAGLPQAFDGLRIAQLSDLHAGPTPHAHIARAAEMAAATEADVLVLTGDFVSGWAGHAATLVPLLAGLRAPLGVYAILGNHDHWTDAGVVSEHLQTAGVRLLRNEAVPLARARQTLWLAGVDDVWERRANLPQTLADVPPGAPVVLLAHEPDYADEVADQKGSAALLLQLSGHSHGGQVRIPGLGAPILPYLAEKYPSGAYRVGDMWLYTNRGVGTIQPRVRLNCRPEVTLLTLHTAE